MSELRPKLEKLPDKEPKLEKLLSEEGVEKVVDASMYLRFGASSLLEVKDPTLIDLIVERIKEELRKELPAEELSEAEKSALESVDCNQLLILDYRSTSATEINRMLQEHFGDIDSFLYSVERKKEKKHPLIIIRPEDNDSSGPGFLQDINILMKYGCGITIVPDDKKYLNAAFRQTRDVGLLLGENTGFCKVVK